MQSMAELTVSSLDENAASSPGENQEAQTRYSKRKRRQINYYEGGVDYAKFQSEVGTDMDWECSQSKKRKAASSQSLLPHKTFPFMKLPAEIRNMIYKLCLTDSSSFYLVAHIKNKRRVAVRVNESVMNQVSRSGMGGTGYLGKSVRVGYGKDFGFPKTLAPSLMVANKQVYAETRSMLYEPEFVFADTLALHCFLSNLGPRASSFLRKIRIKRWGSGRRVYKAYNHASFALLLMAENIEKITVDQFHGPECLYREAFPWIDSVGAKRGIDAALDVLDVVHPSMRERFRSEMRKLFDGHMHQIRSKPGRKLVK